MFASIRAIKCELEIWDLVSSTDDSFIKDKLTVAANDKGIPKPGDSQMV